MAAARSKIWQKSTFVAMSPKAWFTDRRVASITEYVPLFAPSDSPGAQYSVVIEEPPQENDPLGKE